MKTVARNWAGERDGAESTAGDPLTAAIVAQLPGRAAQPVDECEIALVDLPTVKLFYSLSTQWTFEPMSGRRIGLDYSRIPAVAEMLRIDDLPDRFLDLQTMEAAALSVFASRR